MGTHIRLKFTPVVKYFPKPNSNNCWLEIIPIVSSIENFDKIEWSQQKGAVEYIVPMTYKIILKRREPEHQLRVYYSCIDLLSSMSSLDLNAGDIYRTISDNFIVRKAINENFENKPEFDLNINCRKHDIKVNNKVRDAYLPISEVKLNEKENTQAANGEYKILERDSIEKLTRTESKIDKSNINNRSTDVSQVNLDNKNKEDQQKKLCITKVCKISTADEISCKNYVNTDFITMPCLNLSVNNIQTKSIKCMENIDRPFHDSLVNCFVRVDPEIRIAQFVQNMEKEVFPLKILLNEILKKCATLGLRKNVSSNISGGNKYITYKHKRYHKTSEVQTKVQSNRVVYSIVFD